MSMSRIYDNWVNLVEAVVRREKDRQLAYCESISSCCSSDFSSRFSLDHHLQDAAPLGDDACLAGDTLPPPNSKVYGFADLKITTRSFIVSISMHHVLKRPQSGSGLIKPPTSKHDVENFPLQHGSLAPPKRYKFHELEKITRSFDEKLGEGGYARVYKGKLGDGRPVAVKVFGAKVDSSSSGEDNFMNEVASISRTSHVNVVTLLGLCSEGSKRALVYEFMPNSSLDKFLSHNKSAVATMDLEKLHKIAVGIAKGLEYLHNGCTTRIVHFDIKPQNILLDEDFCPKIADFGLAKLCKKKQSILSVLGTRGTVGYIAPEVFSRNFGGVSHKSDVYSYGMLLLNMAQQQKVVESNQAAEAEVVQSSEDYFPDNIYDEIIRDVGFDESLVIEDGEKETITKMCVVGLWCIQTNPSKRPPIAKVVEMLEGSLKSIPIPPKPMLDEPIPESSSTQNSYVLKQRQSGSGLIKPPTSKHDVENFLLQHGSLAPKRYKFRELKKITRSFGEKLGEGGYGRVYKGKLGDGRPVAVKVLTKVDSSGEDFINEVDCISRTSHVNIVTLLGFCSQGSKRALVYEFMPNTSLNKFLSHNQSAVATMDLEKLHKIAVGIAKGLEYLHNGCTTRIVHFDIKPQNILLDEDFCPKIADFGLAKLCKKKQSILSSMQARGTMGYIAPELMDRNFGGVSHKSDVYSYGMLLLNMAQQQKVVESNQAEAEVVQSSEDYFPDNLYDEVIRDVGLELDEEKETITKMRVVGLWCIQTSPSTRPSISKVVEMLERSLNSIQIPPKPMLYDEPIPESSSTQNSSDHD